MEIKDRDKSTAEQIGRPFKPSSHNEGKEDGDKEEYVGAPLASTKDVSPDNKGNGDGGSGGQRYSRV